MRDDRIMSKFLVNLRYKLMGINPKDLRKKKYNKPNKQGKFAPVTEPYKKGNSMTDLLSDEELNKLNSLKK